MSHAHCLECGLPDTAKDGCSCEGELVVTRENYRALEREAERFCLDALGQGIIVLVCGGRDFDDDDALFGVLDRVHTKKGIRLVIHGAAKGADSAAERWARATETAYLGVPARWGLDEKSAGPKRNRRMVKLLRPDVVLAFPGGRGTADMVLVAQTLSIPTWEPMKADA